MIRKGIFRADKVEYSDGVGCSLWRVFPDSDEDIGICWDFAFDELDDIMFLLGRLYSVTPETYSE